MTEKEAEIEQFARTSLAESVPLGGQTSSSPKTMLINNGKDHARNEWNRAGRFRFAQWS